MVNDVIGHSGNDALDANRRNRPFRLDRAFVVSQFLAVRVEVFFPECFVVFPDVGDGKAVERAASAMTTPGSSPILLARCRLAWRR